MGQSVAAEIAHYNVNVTPLYVDAQDRLIEVVAVLVDANGNKIGTVDTDHYEVAPNLPVALFKAYRLLRKLDKGTLAPEANL